MINMYKHAKLWYKFSSYKYNIYVMQQLQIQ